MPVLLGGLVYYLLGALWFSPLLFEKQWDRALGFDRPPGWKPTLVYYVGPLLGCIAVALGVCLAAEASQARDWQSFARIGALAGLLVSLPVTLTNAISPKTAEPLRFAAVVGAYHVLGAVLAGIAMSFIET